LKLYNEFKYFRTKKYQEIKHNNKIKIHSEIFYVNNIIKIKNNKKLNMPKKIKSIIDEIINFLLTPDYMEKLEPYIQIKKQKKIKPSAYIVKKYFNIVFGYKYHELEEAVKGIKLILKEEMI
jgi:hypothetical protein